MREILISVVLGAGVFGVVATVAGQFIVDWIREGVETQGFEGFWGPILLVVLGALAVIAIFALLIVSIISPRGRERWAGFGKWLWSWRPVSYRRHRRELTQQNEAMLAEVGSVAGAVSENEASTDKVAKWAYDAIEKVRLSIPDVTLELLKQMQESKKSIEELRTSVDQLEKPKRGEVTVDCEASKRAAAASLQPAPPLPRPRWHASPDNVPDLDQYVIQNMVPRSVAREVRVEAVEAMDIIDAGHWEDLSTNGPTGGTGTFIGVVNQRGRMNHVEIVISWYDEKGEKDSVRKMIFPKEVPGPEPAGEKVATWDVPPEYGEDTPF